MKEEVKELQEFQAESVTMNYTFKQAEEQANNIYQDYTRLMLATAQQNHVAIPEKIDEQLNFLQHLHTLFGDKVVERKRQLLNT